MGERLPQPDGGSCAFWLQGAERLARIWFPEDVSDGRTIVVGTSISNAILDRHLDGDEGERVHDPVLAELELGACPEHQTASCAEPRSGQVSSREISFTYTPAPAYPNKRQAMISQDGEPSVGKLLPPPSTPRKSAKTKRTSVRRGTAEAQIRSRKRSEDRLAKKFAPHRGEQYQAHSSFDAQDLPTSSTGWKGVRSRMHQGREIRNLSNKDLKAILCNFMPIPFDHGNVPDKQLPTFIRDCKGRLIVWRSHLSQWIFHSLEDIAAFSADFVTSCPPPSQKARLTNVRGEHWFCILGHHRQYSPQPILAAWHAENKGKVSRFLEKGGILDKLSTWGCNCLRAQFPQIALRFQQMADYHEKVNGIKPMFDLFWNFCLNAPLHGRGIDRVHCKPHVDKENISIGLCMLFVYQGTTPFNHREYSWLVIWEAKVIIQIPPGVFVLYPSALLYHFNVDPKDLEFVVTLDGETPTRTNSYPLSRAQDGPGGRGSMVWFNQASMLQSSELGCDTIQKFKAAKGHGKTSGSGVATTPSKEMIENGVFPGIL